MSNVILLGDPHVGKNVSLGKSTLGANLNSRIADQLNLLDWTLDRALDQHSEHIIITGDVFEDPKPHPSLLTMFVSWLKKCQVHNVHVHIIVGNHDILRSGFVYTSPLDVINEVELENVSIYKDVDTIIIGSTAFTLVPFRDRKSFGVNTNAEAISLLRDSLVYELASIPVTYQKVLIGHLAIEGAIPVGDEIDDITNELFCPLDMFVGYDYTWMGHVHKPQVMQKVPHVAHIGSMDISNFGETDQKKFIVIFNCATKQDPWFTEDLPTRPLKKISITVPKDTEDSTEYVLNEIKKEGSWNKAIVRVEVSLATPELKSINKAVIEKYLSSEGAFNVTGITESKKQSIIKKDVNNTIDTKMDVSTSIKTYADKYIDDKSSPQFIELGMEILNLYKLEEKETIATQISASGNRMKPARLYIKDFMCYDWAYIDFTQFSSALIVGKTEGNDDEANGVGKTTIFRALEYILFNQSDFNLENIIQDDAASCKVVFDFTIGDAEYRLVRKRTRKGSADLSLYERTAETGPLDQVLHNDIYDPTTDKKYWKDISSRRTADTEKDLAKLIKINYKSFRAFVHFVQHDFTSLATATSEKRKAILKDALNLVIYSKLEKLAKEKSAALSRELDRCAALIIGLGDPDSDLNKLQSQIIDTEKELCSRQGTLTALQENLEQFNITINDLSVQYSGLEAKFSSLVSKEHALVQGKSKIETSIKEYKTKKRNIIQEAHILMSEIKQLEDTQTKLVATDFSQIDILAEKIEEKKVLVTQHNINIKSSMEEYEELKIPIPTDSVCKHCRQNMTEQHRKDCIAKDKARMVELQASIKESKSSLYKLNMEIQASQQTINTMVLTKQHLESVMNKIATKKKEMADKQIIHSEYGISLDRFSTELEDKEQELVLVRNELENSPVDEAKVLQQQIQKEKQNLAALQLKINLTNKEITYFTSQKAVLQHNIDQKNQDKQKKNDLSKLIKDLESKLGMYPLVILAFSTIGIPNLVIHNILDDLQIEVNRWLSQLRPDLQLSFLIEKTQGDGTEADVLDIHYQVGGKQRYNEQLSGAMKLMVLFSLKLGLSFLLQNLLGIEIKFLLLDELDQSLSKGRVDAFVDIIKVLQNDFTILVITHNDHLKDKFSHAILVEQDINMVSKARVVSSW
jgi:DNA repair exonuclease SbcCD ATPase subunit/DNA repair exonuclease SbcCD nuclease subunit